MTNWIGALRAFSLAAVILAAGPAAAGSAPPEGSGVLHLKSGCRVDEAVARIKADVAGKGIRFFDAIDQAALAEGAGIALKPSVLLLFGNPPLGTQFLAANPYAGLDWPVRMLVFEDAAGQVWIAYTDFAFIAKRYKLTGLTAQLKMASEVAASIAASAQSCAS